MQEKNCGTCANFTDNENICDYCSQFYEVDEADQSELSDRWKPIKRKSGDLIYDVE